MDVSRLLRCLLTLLKLTKWLRLARKALTVAILALCCGGALGWLLQKKQSKKALKKVIGRVIG